MAEWASMFDVRRDVTPPLAEEQFSQVPAKRGVLLLAAEGDEPITLITAGSLRGRLRTRLAEDDQDAPSRKIDLRQVARAVFWKLTDSHFETDLAFLELARTIWPKRYRSMVAWKPAWFVHVDGEDDHPHFARTREVFTSRGEYVGPFPSGRSADRFVQDVQDAFDLCRDIKCLRSAPNGAPCSYGQMGRCLLPCDGTTSMADYRQVVRQAAAFAAGNRQATVDSLTRQMTAAAEQLEFGKAASVKIKLERLAGFDHPDFALVAPATAFAFLMVQRGPNSRTAKTFLVNQWDVQVGPALNYPIQTEQIAAVWAQMSGLVETGPRPDEAALLKMGLIAYFLFAGDHRRGVILPVADVTGPSMISEAVEAATDALKLRAPKPRKPKKATGPSPDEPPPGPTPAGTD